MSLKTGDIIDGKYRIVRLIGEGGMGSVYEGENVRIARRVAIKILHANVASQGDAVQRFEREAQAAGRIGSEHIVEVLDLGELADGDRYMVMEFLEGEPLNERISNMGKLPPQTAARIVVEMLDGLKAAHAAGIIHRDLKPDNVFLLTSRSGRRDFVKVVDFGISKFSTLGGEFSMTQTGAVMGTPYYLSPEQAKGERHVDQRSDIYAVGVILWEATVGRVPFDGETFNELLFKIVLEPIPNLAEIDPTMDPTFVQIVEKAMARNPVDRFETAEDLQRALETWLAGQPVPAEMLEHRASMVSIDRDAIRAATSPAITRTNGNWANTNPEDAPKAQSKATRLIAAAAVVLLGLGVFAYQRNATQAEAAKALAQAEQEAAARADEQKHETELARLETERAQAAADLARAEKEKSEAERLRTEAQLSAAEQARKLAQEEKEREEEEERQRVAQQAAARRAAAPRRAQPSPAPAPQPTGASGRKIRTEL